MDTSPEYMKMCEKAEEIQKEWNNKIPIEKHKSVIYDPKSKQVYEPTIFGESVSSTIPVNCIWLPRQDQLQEIFGKESSLALLERFKSWIDDNCTEEKAPWFYKEQYKGWSLEQLWLVFVMKKKYGKIWNPTRKEWEASFE